MIIVASIKPADLKLASKNPGPELLKEYLEFAWNVSAGKVMSSPAKDVPSSNDWYLKSKLKEVYLPGTLSEDFTFSDLTYKKDKVCVGVVITDDEKYRSAMSVKDQHGYMPLILSQKNWKVFKAYSRQWWKNNEDLKQSLVKHMVL